MPGQIQANGGQPQKPTKSATLYTGRFYFGLNTNRSPLRGSQTAMVEKFYGGSSNDLLIGGLNTEISNRLTLCRRPGNPIYTNPTTSVVSASFDGVDRFEAFHLLGPTTENIDVMIDTIGTSGGDRPSIWTGLDATGVSGTFPGGSQKALVYQKTVAQQAFMESVGNTLFFGDSAEQAKWLETVLTWASVAASVQPLPAGQYPFLSTYIIDSNIALQQLLATVLTNSASNVTIAPDGITVTLNFVAGQAASTGLVAGGGSTASAAAAGGGSPVTFYGFSTFTQLNGVFGYVSAISTDRVTVILTAPVAVHTIASDTGYMIMVNGGTPTVGASEPMWATVALVPAAVWPYPANILTLDGTALWICRSKPTATQAAGIFNWGIKGPTGVLAKVSPNVGSGAWASNTFYSLDGVLIDLNGNLQLVTTAGSGGATAPAWATSTAPGSNTTTAVGGTAVWTCIQLAASLARANSTVYCPQHVDANGNPIQGTGQYVVATAAGAPCLFQLQPSLQPQIIQQGVTTQTNMSSGDYVDLWYYAGDGNSGLFQPVPATVGGASATAKVNSLAFNIQGSGDPNIQPMTNWALKQSGEYASTSTVPYAGATSGYSMVALFSVLITPESFLASGGQYTVRIGHDDGFVLGCAQSNVTYSDPSENLNSQTTSALNGYTLIGGVNINGVGVSTGTLTVPAPGTYDFELDYFQHINEQTLIFQINGYVPAPAVGPYAVTAVSTAAAGGVTVYAGTFPVGIASPVGQWFLVTGFTNAANNGYFLCSAATTTHLTLENNNGILETATAVATCKSVVSMASAPAWPAWGVSSAPKYPSITETGTFATGYPPTGNYLTWANHGPTADFTWIKNKNFTQPNDAILDTNGNQEGPYRTGYTSATQPTWTLLTLNSLTNDNPSLIWINEGPLASVANPVSLTVATGWEYGIALANTLDDTVSNMSQFSPTTGPFSNANYIQLPAGYGLPTNLSLIDLQADYVAIFRTTDGGATPLLIPGLGNSVYTVPLNEYLANGYQDTTPDTGLSIELQGAEAGENTPPALGAINLCYHLSRMFYSIGNIVYWTSGPADPIGNGLQGTAPANFTTMPSLVKKMFPTSIGLLVFTLSDVYIIPGQGTTANPLQPGQPYLPGVGLLSYNAFDNCGTIITMLTTDNSLMMIDPGGGYVDAGQPIGNNFGLQNNVLGQDWSPKNAYIAWYVNGEDQGWYAADGQVGWYRLCSTPAPETGYGWSPFAQIAGGTYGTPFSGTPSIKAVQSIEVQPGTKRLLIGPSTTGQILRRASLFQPSFTDGGSAYRAYGDIGSLVLTNPGQLAAVNFVTTECVRVGTPNRIGVLFDEAEPYTSVPFDVLTSWQSDPTNQPKSRSVLAQRFYMSEDENVDALCRTMQIRIDFGFDTVQNELLTLSVVGAMYAEN